MDMYNMNKSNYKSPMESGLFSLDTNKLSQDKGRRICENRYYRDAQNLKKKKNWHNCAKTMLKKNREFFGIDTKCDKENRHPNAICEKCHRKIISANRSLSAAYQNAKAEDIKLDMT